MADSNQPVMQKPRMIKTSLIRTPLTPVPKKDDQNLGASALDLIMNDTILQEQQKQLQLIREEKQRLQESREMAKRERMRGRTVVIHPCGTELKIGFANDSHPLIVPQCVSFKVEEKTELEKKLENLFISNDFSSSDPFSGNKNEPKTKDIEKEFNQFKEKELLEFRKELLVQRHIFEDQKTKKKSSRDKKSKNNKEKEQEETYFEEIVMRQSDIPVQQSPFSQSPSKLLPPSPFSSKRSASASSSSLSPKKFIDNEKSITNEENREEESSVSFGSEAICSFVNDPDHTLIYYPFLRKHIQIYDSDFTPKEENAQSSSNLATQDQKVFDVMTDLVKIRSCFYSIWYHALQQTFFAREPKNQPNQDQKTEIVTKPSNSFFQFPENSKFDEFSCIFIMPDELHINELQFFLSILFNDFKFGKISVLTESVCAMWGSGFITNQSTNTMVVANMDSLTTTITTLEDGFPVNSTTTSQTVSYSLFYKRGDSRIVLPFGSQDAAHYLNFILNENKFGLFSENEETFKKMMFGKKTKSSNQDENARKWFQYELIRKYFFGFEIDHKMRIGPKNKIFSISQNTKTKEKEQQTTKRKTIFEIEEAEEELFKNLSFKTIPNWKKPFSCAINLKQTQNHENNDQNSQISSEDKTNPENSSKIGKENFTTITIEFEEQNRLKRVLEFDIGDPLLISGMIYLAPYLLGDFKKWFYTSAFHISKFLPHKMFISPPENRIVPSTSMNSIFDSNHYTKNRNSEQFPLFWTESHLKGLGKDINLTPPDYSLNLLVASIFERKGSSVQIETDPTPAVSTKKRKIEEILIPTHDDSAPNQDLDQNNNKRRKLNEENQSQPESVAEIPKNENLQIQIPPKSQEKIQSVPTPSKKMRKPSISGTEFDFALVDDNENEGTSVKASETFNFYAGEPKKLQKHGCLSLDQGIIESLRLSGIRLPATKKKNTVIIQVLLVGELPHMDGLSEMLRQKLQKHYDKSFEVFYNSKKQTTNALPSEQQESVKIPEVKVLVPRIVCDEENEALNLPQSAVIWKGGCLATRIYTQDLGNNFYDDCFVSIQEYKQFGFRKVIEKSPIPLTEQTVGIL